MDSMCVIPGSFSEESDSITHCYCEKIILVVSNPPLLKLFTASVCMCVHMCKSDLLLTVVIQDDTFIMSCIRHDGF